MQADGRYCGVPNPQADGNRALRAARRAHGWSQEEFAERFEAAARELGLGLSLSVRQVRRWESASPPWPHPPYRKVLQHLYLRPAEELGFSRPYEPVLLDEAQVQPRTLEPESGSEEDEVLRREFLRVAGLGTLSANRIGFALLAPSSVAPSGLPPSFELLAKHVADVKTMFQACEYAELDSTLPEKLAAAATAVETAESDDAQSFAQTAHVDLLHVASGLLLKQGHPELALIAADRASRAAEASGNTIAQLAAARILTHASFAVGQHAIAAELVDHHANRFAASIDTHSSSLTSVYGSLLLRGSIAAAKQGDRHRTASLLDEATGLAGTLPAGANFRWTSFNTDNVFAHRVATAVELGDAGEAIDSARQINFNTIIVNERRAAVWVDIARAFGQWRKNEAAVRALLTAEEIAPEELHGRRAVQLLVEQLRSQQRGKPSSAFTELATRVGAPA